jgi:hypothetical protein
LSTGASSVDVGRIDERKESVGGGGWKQTHAMIPPKKLSCAAQRFGRDLVPISPGPRNSVRYADNGAASPALPAKITHERHTSCKVPAPQHKSNSRGTDALLFFSFATEFSQSRRPMYSNTYDSKAPGMTSAGASMAVRHVRHIITSHPIALKPTPQDRIGSSLDRFSPSLTWRLMSPTVVPRQAQVTQSIRTPRFRPRNRLHLRTESSQTTPRAQTTRIRHRGGDTTNASEMN